MILGCRVVTARSFPIESQQYVKKKLSLGIFTEEGFFLKVKRLFFEGYFLVGSLHDIT